MEKEINMSYEDAIRRLDKIIDALENGNTTLDESLSLFEEGTKIFSYCYSKLNDTEKKISLISEKMEGK